MSNSRLLLMGLGLVLVLVTGGIVVMSMPGKLLSVDSAQGPIGAVSGPNTNTNGTTGGEATPSAPNNPSNTSSSNSTDQAAQTNANSSNNHNLYCPKRSELFKKEMFWYGPNSWRDYSASFVNNINNFAGAQWVGVNVGKIICLYKGVEENNFPVAIERDNLMKKPDGEQWKPDPSGYQICKSDNVMDCPFVPQDIKSNENVYDFLKDIKK